MVCLTVADGPLAQTNDPQAERVQTPGPDHFRQRLNSGVTRTFHEFLPGSELFLIPGARHFVQLDETEQVARLILAMPGPGALMPVTK